VVENGPGREVRTEPFLQEGDFVIEIAASFDYKDQFVNRPCRMEIPHRAVVLVFAERELLGYEALFRTKSAV